MVRVVAPDGVGVMLQIAGWRDADLMQNPAVGFRKTLTVEVDIALLGNR